MIKFLRSLVHRVAAWHHGAVRICDDPFVMWCPCCKLAWGRFELDEEILPPPPKPKQRPADQ